MPILVQKIVDGCNFKLDAEGSQRYLFDQDFKPAINMAIETATSIFNSAFADNKLSPECLRELVKIQVWQASQYSRVSIADVDINGFFWTILAVYPKPKCNKGVSGIPSTDKSESKFRPELSYLSSDQSAKRLTFEQWNENKKNVFMPGNVVLAGGLVEYAYLDFADYSSTSYTGNKGKFELEIRPDISGQLVAIGYLKYPKNITVIGDSIDFPQSLTDFITEITLNHLSVKQGDGTTLNSTTEKWMAQLVNLMK